MQKSFRICAIKISEKKLALRWQQNFWRIKLHDYLKHLPNNRKITSNGFLVKKSFNIMIQTKTTTNTFSLSLSFALKKSSLIKNHVSHPKHVIKSFWKKGKKYFVVVSQTHYNDASLNKWHLLNVLHEKRQFSSLHSRNSFQFA